MTKLADIRREFFGAKLDEQIVPKAPVEFFQTWLDQAFQAEISDANAFVLASVDSSDQPQTRVLLLKDFSAEGFVFYTNFNSDKGKQLQANPKASILFFWQELARQVKINGIVEKISNTQAEAYFATRPRDSKIGALASNQSQVIGKDELQANFANLEKNYSQVDEIPKPEHWGGYILKPNYFEFWQGQASRFHDRICYKKIAPDQVEKTNWEIFRRAP